MSEVSSFPPLVPPGSRVMVLGSMPGVASLKANQYYAHGRNQFWPLMCDILGVSPVLDYADKITLLADHHIAVWDVLATCVRPGSLDTSIREEVANDFNALFTTLPDLTHVFFNGQKAETCFQRLVMPSLSDDVKARVKFITLPSTSPANASYSYARKRDAWAEVADVAHA